MLAALEFPPCRVEGQDVSFQKSAEGLAKGKTTEESVATLPACIAYGIAMDLIARGKRVMGLKVLMDFDAYLRPGESLGLKVKDILKPVRGAGPQFRFYSIIIRDQEDLGRRQDRHLRQHSVVQHTGSGVCWRDDVESQSNQKSCDGQPVQLHRQRTSGGSSS